MRIGILLPSLFAATLLSTVALADNNDDNNDKGALRGSSAKERVVRESRSRDAKERAHVQTKETSIRPASKAPAKLADKRGCSTDDGSSCSKTGEKAVKTQQIQSQKVGEAKMPSRLLDRGCATEDGNGCSSSSKPHADGAGKASGGERAYMVQSAKSAQTTEEIMKMRKEVDAKRMLDMLKLKMCARDGSCGDANDF